MSNFQCYINAYDSSTKKQECKVAKRRNRCPSNSVEHSIESAFTQHDFCYLSNAPNANFKYILKRYTNLVYIFVCHSIRISSAIFLYSLWPNASLKYSKLLHIQRFHHFLICQFLTCSVWSNIWISRSFVFWLVRLQHIDGIPTNLIIFAVSFAN